MSSKRKITRVPLPLSDIDKVKSTDILDYLISRKLRDGWLTFGLRDDAPQVLKTLYYASITNKKCLQFITRFIESGKFAISAGSTGTDAEKAAKFMSDNDLQLKKWVSSSAHNLSIYGNTSAALQSIYENGKKKVNIVPYSPIEYRVLDAENAVVSDDFLDKTPRQIITISDWLNLSPDDYATTKIVVKVPIASNENTTELYRFFITNLDDNPTQYAMPFYFSAPAVLQMLSEYAFNRGVFSQTKNNLSAGGVFTVVAPEVTHEHANEGEDLNAAKQRVYDEITDDAKEQLIGDARAANTIIEVVEYRTGQNGEQIFDTNFKHTPFQNEFDEKRFTVISDFVKKGIYTAHGVNPILVEQSEKGGIGNGDSAKEIMASLKMLVFTSISSICDRICELPNLMLKEEGIAANVSIAFNPLFNEQPSETMLNQLLPDDLLREMFGLTNVFTDEQQKEVNNKKTPTL